MLLEIKNITKAYKGKIVLNNFSLDMTCGVYGLLGPNGAGKSTLIGIITGLISPDSGMINYTDKWGSVLNDTLGYLPQYQDYYKNFTAEEFLAYVIALKNFPPKNQKKYISDLLETVNLADNRKKKIRTFSGGMKQRLGIAQAIIGEPNVIIFDEPTAGLDPKERIRFRNIISSLGKDKIVILATHIVTDIAYIAKEVILLDQGNLLASASQDKIIEKVRGKVWHYNCENERIIDVMSKYRVSNVIAGGDRCIVRVVSEEKPFNSAEQVEPNLEDTCLYCFGEI